MLMLLFELNVLFFDEFINDVDIEMLMVIEDLFDLWVGMLIVVLYDWYLFEWVIDQQYVIFDDWLWYLFGGIDEYLQLVVCVSVLVLVEWLVLLVMLGVQ